jgi:cellulose biosynthesis protein BcsQ
LIYQEVSHIHSNGYEDFIRHNQKEDIDFIPANKMLGGIYAILGADGESNTVLSRIFLNDFFKKYDYILFDCPTAVDNLLVSNALQCSTKLLLPVQAELFAYESVTAMLQRFMAIKEVKKYLRTTDSSTPARFARKAENILFLPAETEKRPVNWPESRPPAL